MYVSKHVCSGTPSPVRERVEEHMSSGYELPPAHGCRPILVLTVVPWTVTHGVVSVGESGLYSAG